MNPHQAITYYGAPDEKILSQWGHIKWSEWCSLELDRMNRSKIKNAVRGKVQIHINPRGRMALIRKHA